MVSEVLQCQMAHMAAIREWRDGPAKEYWREPDDVICIAYQSGKWWHYKKDKDGIVWW